MNKTFLVLIAGLILIASAATGMAQVANVPDSVYYPAIGRSKNVALMLLGGAEGGLPNYYDTKGLTENGYPCLVVGYFGTKSTPKRLEMIPLEYFEEAISKFRSEPGMADKKIVVWGGSKGGELALLLASRYEYIKGVIAAVPSSVVFQGIGGRPLSSWSYKGEPIPFVPYAHYDFSKIVNDQYVEVYRLSLEQTEAVDKAVIKVENINGPILLLTGEKDTMWPSSQMGDMIVRRLKEKRFSHWYRHFAYENAGHTLNENHMMGGTAEGNKKARIESQQRVIDFLNKLSDE
jgi:uncharacterized protein